MTERTIIGKSVDAMRTLIKLGLSIMLTCVKSRHDKYMIHALVILNLCHLDHITPKLFLSQTSFVGHRFDLTNSYRAAQFKARGGLTRISNEK